MSTKCLVILHSDIRDCTADKHRWDAYKSSLRKLVGPEIIFLGIPKKKSGYVGVLITITNTEPSLTNPFDRIIRSAPIYAVSGWNCWMEGIKLGMCASTDFRLPPTSKPDRLQTNTCVVYYDFSIPLNEQSFRYNIDDIAISDRQEFVPFDTNFRQLGQEGEAITLIRGKRITHGVITGFGAVNISGRPLDLAVRVGKKHFYISGNGDTRTKIFITPSKEVLESVDHTGELRRYAADHKLRIVRYPQYNEDPKLQLIDPRNYESAYLRQESVEISDLKYDSSLGFHTGTPCLDGRGSCVSVGDREIEEPENVHYWQ